MKPRLLHIGLGLAIVQEIAAQHNATARLRPNPAGRGAIARVVFRTWHPPPPPPSMRGNNLLMCVVDAP